MTKNKGRVVGLDVHPDSFAGAVVQGSDPASAGAGQKLVTA